MPLEDRIEYGTATQGINTMTDLVVDEGKELVRIDLACGQTKKEGFKGVDREKVEGVDFVHDLMEFPWPFADDSVYEFNCEHFVEHIPHYVQGYTKDGFVLFMEEVWRCLMPEGTIRIVCPYFMSEEAFQDPTHTRMISDRTFMYFDKTIVQEKLNHYTGQCNFRETQRKKTVDNNFQGKSEVATRWAIKHYWNVVREAEYVLRKVLLPLA